MRIRSLSAGIFRRVSGVSPTGARPARPDLSVRPVRPGFFPVLFCLTLLVCAGIVFVPASRAGGTAEPVPEHWQGVWQRLVDDGFSPEHMAALFTEGAIPYHPDAMGRKLTSLYRRKYEWRPAEKKKTAKPSGPPVYKSCLEPERIADGLDFLDLHSSLLGQVYEKWGIPGEVTVGLMTVETRLGTYLGDRPALATLASMAACGDEKAWVSFFRNKKLTASRRKWIAEKAEAKAEWAYRELKSLLAYAELNGLNLLSMPGSVYGAIGVCQFMPSNALIFGVDGDGDGKVDLFSMEDAVHSMANYLREHGWRPGLDHSRQRKVLYRYNHSYTYANTILAVAKELRKAR